MMAPTAVPTPGHIIVPIALPVEAPAAPPATPTTLVAILVAALLKNRFPVILPCHQSLKRIPISTADIIAATIQVLLDVIAFANAVPAAVLTVVALPN